MKALKKSISLILIVFLFSCKKDPELPEGGIRFIFRPQHQYNYTQLGASVSYTIYGEPIMSISESDKNKAIELKPIKEGKYYWHYNISFDSSELIGNNSFVGEIIIEKGKLNEIIIED